MPLDQPTTAFLDMLRSSGGKPLYELPLDEARANMATGARSSARRPTRSARSSIAASTCPAAPSAIRIYTPAGAAAAGSVPAVLQYHGGGFVLGNLDTHESIARFYCAHAGAVVVSVDYRLAPEHRFPTQVEDSYAALAWVAGHAGELAVDPGRMAVAGDSAGGNLATVMCLLAKARGGPRIAAQALLYPVVDFRSHDLYASHQRVRRRQLLPVHQGHGLVPLALFRRRRPGTRTRPRRRSRRPISAACLPRWSQPPAAIRCATKGGRMRTAWPRPAFRSSIAASTRPFTRAPRLRARFRPAARCWTSWRTGSAARCTATRKS